MSTESEQVDALNPIAAASNGRRVSLAALVFACLLTVVVTGTAAIALTSYDRHPGDESPEAGFARDMQVHHAQAVEMATIIRDNSIDPGIRAIAYDILTSQQQQMGQMFAWLRTWGLPQNGNQKAMAWMTEDMDHSKMTAEQMDTMTLQPDGRLPGMASEAELKQLRGLNGVAAEKLFLTLMIRHHRAGVAMAEAVDEASSNKQVEELAKAIVKSQSAEITALTKLLEERGESSEMEMP